MKKLVSLFLSMVLALTMFTMVACDGNSITAHEHKFSTTYSFNEVHHWYECECGEYENFEGHVNNDGDGKCDICSYQMVGGHTHSFSATYSSNETSHYKECSCGEKSEVGSHVDGDNNSKCDVCSYQIKEEHTHSYSSSYLNSSISHWKECSCGQKANVGSHVDSDNNGKCDVCLYQMKNEETHTHNFGSTYLYDATNHWKECSCSQKSNAGAHVDNDNNGKCDVCSYQMQVKPSNPTGPQTPVIPNHPTSGDTSYLGQTANVLYTSAMANMTGSGNYTFNASHYVNMSLVGYNMEIGFQTFKAKYAYANNQFYGREEVVVDMSKLGMPEQETMTAQIVCVDNMVYLLAEQNGQVSKIKDDGSYQDLQNTTEIPLDVTSNRLYVPSANALSNAYFNLSNDGATLTVKISGQEAEAFIESMRKDGMDFEFSDIVYVVHFDGNGNIIKINYLFQIYAEFMQGMVACYDYDCVVTITDINTTVVSAPVDANEYIKSEFIA